MSGGHPDRTKLHPLSDHARRVLSSLCHGPCVRQDINPGVTDRLAREDLIEMVDLPSPYASHKGRKIAHARITMAGRRKVDELRGRG